MPRRIGGGLVAGIAAASLLAAEPAPERVLVPGGEQRLGAPSRLHRLALKHCAATSPPGAVCTERILHDERRRARVVVADFSIDRLEVTHAAYRACVEAGRCRTTDWNACRYGDGSAPTGAERAVLARDTHPVVCVTFEQAREFCRWSGGDLPDEAQWERAAGGDRLFPWGDAWDPARANWGDGGAADGHVLTAPAGSHPDGASPHGVEDLVGNVWEWAVRVGGRGERSATGEQVIRGGGFAAAAHAQRVHKRAPYDPRRAYPNVGFRCVGPSSGR